MLFQQIQPFRPSWRVLMVAGSIPFPLSLFNVAALTVNDDGPCQGAVLVGCRPGEVAIRRCRCRPRSRRWFGRNGMRSMSATLFSP